MLKSVIHVYASQPFLVWSRNAPPLRDTADYVYARFPPLSRIREEREPISQTAAGSLA